LWYNICLSKKPLDSLDKLEIARGKEDFTLNSYELMLIFDPNLGEEKIGAMVSKIEGKITSLKGEVEKTDKWGTRPLASTMSRAKKLKQGYYVVIYFKGKTSLPGGLQSYLKVTENIVRYSIVRAVERPPAEIKGAPLGGEGEIEAVNIGEITEAGPSTSSGLGDISGQS
jgi:small subunit ribosomal protein S6